MSERIWECKIGGAIPGFVKLPSGLDGPMRSAIQRAFREVTGVDAQFCFSGWGAKLVEAERACVENRPPNDEVMRAEFQAQFDHARACGFELTQTLKDAP